MADLKVVSERVFVGTGGGKLALGLEGEVKKGDNTIKFAELGPDVSPAAIELIEAGDQAPNSLTLQSAEVFKKGGASVKFTAEKTGSAEATALIDLPVSVSLGHRLVVDTNKGTGEWSSSATITNSGKTDIQGAKLSLIVGEEQPNYRRGGMLESARSMKATTQVSSAGATTYRYDHPKELSLSKGQSVKLNLFTKDFSVKDLGEQLSLESNGSYHGRNSRQGNAGDVVASYTIPNTSENGLGRVFPAGSVEVLTTEGVRMGAPPIRNISEGEEILLGVGKAFDVEAERRQVSYEQSGGGRGTGSKVMNVTASQEINLVNRSKKEKSVNVTETGLDASDPNSIDVSDVKVNGTALDASQWKVDKEEGQIQFSNLVVPKDGGEIKPTFTVKFKGERWD